MLMGRGRPNKYLTNVEPRFNEIREWLKAGATDKEIANLLGINKATLVEYKHKYYEFNELIKSGRRRNVEELKNALYKKAIGFTYTEKEEIYDIEGLTKSKARVKETTKVSLPSETAILILLKHWDRNEDGTPKWMNDPATFELKKEELKIKKEQAENSNW